MVKWETFGAASAELNLFKFCRTDAKPREELSLLKLFRGAKEEDQKSIVTKENEVK